jgi:hypothetical protein
MFECLDVWMFVPIDSRPQDLKNGFYAHRKVFWLWKSVVVFTFLVLNPSATFKKALCNFLNIYDLHIVVTSPGFYYHRATTTLPPTHNTKFGSCFSTFNMGHYLEAFNVFQKIKFLHVFSYNVEQNETLYQPKNSTFFVKKSPKTPKSQNKHIKTIVCTRPEPRVLNFNFLWQS